jgi:hypothetical protein
MALASTQPVTEMSTSNISLGGKDVRCVGLTTLPPSSADYLGIWKPRPPGTLTACPGLYRDIFYLVHGIYKIYKCGRIVQLGLETHSLKRNFLTFVEHG